MNKNQAIIHYLMAQSVFQKWRDEGLINEEEFRQINALIADNYGLPKGSLYR